MKFALFATYSILAACLYPDVSQAADAPPSEVLAAGTAVPAGANIEAVPAQIHAIIMQRCAQCHAEHPTMMGSPAAGIRLDTAAEIDENAETIYQQTVIWQSMPLSNVTGMTEDERAQVARWYRAGGKP